MKVAIASDHAGYKLKSFLIEILEEDNLLCNDLGCENTESVDYPDYAAKVTRLVQENSVDFGILICSSGIGMSIMANKFSNIRAALCHDAESAKSARKHNNANILCLASKNCDSRKAIEIVNAFIKNKFSNEIRHIRRLKKIEEKYMTNSIINFYNNRIEETDSDIAELINLEEKRQLNTINLIASENLASKAVRSAQGSILTNKYAEGYPFARYYSGCKYVDQIEKLAQERLCKLFSCDFANVQPHSGSQANQAVFNSLLKPGDKILGMSLNSGGHLTHGSKPNLSGKMFEAVQYNVDKDTYLIDMDNVKQIAYDERPKLIIAGASAYSRVINFKAFREIADSVGALLLADIAHYSGLIATKLYPSPVNYAHIITSTTHKTLRGPRGGVIMTNDAMLYKKINSAVFPGLQGGPLMHVIAGKAVAFKEALDPSFLEYSKNIMNNAKVLAQTLIDNGVNLITNGTDCHMVIVDLRQNNRYGNNVADDLEEVGIICNKNAIPFDEEKPQVTSGIRLGTAFETSKGLNENHFHEIGKAIADIIKKSDTKENIKNRLSHIYNIFDRIS